MAERAVLVLGAGGFIGRPLAARLAARGTRVIAAVRTPTAFEPGIEVRVTGELSAASDWGSLLAEVGAIIHLASRAHAPAAGEGWIEAEAATAAALAAAARRQDVERILFLSSVKVHGESSGASRFRASDPPAPRDPYGRAKLRLEATIAASGVPLAVLRPPLVYGPGVKANFLALMRLVGSGVPLPLASIANRRSLVYLDNLLDLVERALVDPKALGQAFLLRDDREVATPELLRLIGSALGRPARLMPCPPGVLAALLRLAGRNEDALRLMGSLAVDDEATRARLGWRPRVALEDGIVATCRWFRERPDAHLGPGNSASVRPSTR